MSNIYTLASIIQGEASNPNDQFGVASVIANRASSNYGGYGTDAFSQAIAPSQFSAFPNALQPPSPNAVNLATALDQGNLSSYGNTGNALFYNAPGTNAAYASGYGNSYGPGTNQYSDVYNQPPSSSFQLPQANNSPYVSPGSNDASIPSQFDASASDTGGIGSDAVAGGTAGDTGLFSGNPASVPFASGGGGAGMGSPGQISGLGQALGQSGGTSTFLDTSASATPSNQQGDWSKYGVVAVANAGSAVANAIGNSVNTASNSVTTWFQSALTNIAQYFVRGGIAIFGVILILLALSIIMKPNLPPVTIAAAAE